MLATQANWYLIHDFSKGVLFLQFWYANTKKDIKFHDYIPNFILFFPKVWTFQFL